MRSKAIAAILLLSIFFAGCSDQSVPPERPSQSVSQLPQAIDADETARDIQSEPLSVYPGFEGIDISDDGLKFSTLNNKSGSSQIFCSSEDMIFFSNPSDEWKLYSLDGGNLTRLTDIKAYSLNYFDGGIYFLSSEEEYDEKNYLESKQGTLYRYDIESGETEQLSDITMRDLCVCETGIYYADVINETDETYGEIPTVYGFDPESNESAPAYRGFGPQYIDGYNIALESSGGGAVSYLEKNGEKIPFAIRAVPLHSCIHNGVYYFWDGGGSGLYSVDLKNAEILFYKGGVNYTVFENDVYVAADRYLTRYREGGAEPETVKIENNEYVLFDELENHITYRIINLYSSDKSMYALVSETGNGKYRFARLETPKTSEFLPSDELENLLRVVPLDRKDEKR